MGSEMCIRDRCWIEFLVYEKKKKEEEDPVYKEEDFFEIIFLLIRTYILFESITLTMKSFMFNVQNIFR